MTKQVFTDKKFNGALVAPVYTGIPAFSAENGSIIIDTGGDSMYFYSSGTWTPVGGGDEPYVDINASGTLPIANSPQTIAIGPYTSANAGNDIAIGYSAYTVDIEGGGSIAIGYRVYAASKGVAIGQRAGTFNPFGPFEAGVKGVAIGYGAGAIERNAVAIGAKASVINDPGQGNPSTNSIAIGYKSRVSPGVNTIAIGYYTRCYDNDSIVIGRGSKTFGGDGAIAIGVQANTNDTFATVIGNSATSYGSSSVAIGHLAYVGDTRGVSIGFSSKVRGSAGIAIGEDAYARSVDFDVSKGSIAIGHEATAGSSIASSACIAIGNGSTANNASIAIGIGSNALGTNSIVIGNLLDSGFASNAITIGHDNASIFSLIGSEPITIGTDNISNNSGVLIGHGNRAAPKGVSIGVGVSSSSGKSVAIGYNVLNSGFQGNVLIGPYTTNTNGVHNIVIGKRARLQYATFGRQCISLGYYATTTASTGGISIGARSAVNASKSISIGYKATSDLDKNVVIGYNTAHTGADTVAIGPKLKMTGAVVKAVVLGYYTETTSNAYGAVNIGFKNQSLASSGSTNIGNRNVLDSQPFSVCIGDTNTLNDGPNIQIDSPQQTYVIGRTNTVSDCLQTIVMGEQHNVTTATDNIVMGCDNTVTGNLYTGTGGGPNFFNNIVIGVRQTAITNSNAVRDSGARIMIGTDNVNGAVGFAGAYQSVQIGVNQFMGNGSNRSISIGANADVQENSTACVAIGQNSNIGSGQDRSFQFGSGTNSRSTTMQFLNRTFVNQYGTETQTFAGIPANNAPDGTIAVDTTNNRLYFRSSGTWVAAN